MAHTAHFSMTTLEEVFGKLWLPRALDLNLCYYSYY
jgi:hypothetical protein